MRSIFKKIIIGLVLLAVLITAVFLLGPKMEKPQFSNQITELQYSYQDLNAYVSHKERLAGAIKENNEARIIWNDSVPAPTEYAIVYLHGFGASHMEGFPVNVNLADSLNANLYLARLAGHGLVAEDAFAGLTAEKYMQSAIDALAVGQKLGEKVILMGTSTGASQALYLAAQFPDAVHALVLYSPYIKLANNAPSDLALGPWGRQIGRLMIGGDITEEQRPDSVAAYWSTHYHLDGYVSLFSMIDATMRRETFEQVECPVFLGYYYKNEEKQDQVVSVAAMQQMFEQLSSDNKKQVAFPEAENHVIGSALRSENWRAVQDSSWLYLKEVAEQ